MSEVLTLNDVCSLIADCEHKTAPESTPGREFGYSIGTPNIRSGRMILSSAKRVDEATFRSWSARAVLQKNDIILTREAPAGEAAIVDGTVPVCLGQRTVLLRPNPEVIIPRYLHYRLLGPGVQEIIHSRSEGSTVAHLNVKDIRRLVLGDLPDLPLQEAIATLLGALDDKIAVNDQIGQSALELAMAKYGELVGNGRLSRLIPMSDCGRWLSGGTPNTSDGSYWGGNIPWISASSLKSPWINDSDRKVTVLGAKDGTRLVPADTIIFVVRGMSLISEFRIGLTQREVAFGQDCKALLPATGIDAAVLFVAIRSQTPGILRIVDHAGHGTGRLATDLVSKVTLSLPDAGLNEKITAVLRPLIAIGAAKQEENGNLRDLRDMLLPNLLSGEIRVRDAEKVVEEVT